jgi:predicted nucleic acid-binding protein
MTLVDAGPLIALIDRGQGDTHRRCLEAQSSLTSPLLTSWPCFTEAMYFLGNLAGWKGQESLWKFVDGTALLIHAPSARETERMRELMEQYNDVPMDLADASLVTIAESLGLRKIFTLDSDFHIYRIGNKEPFDVIPLGSA